MNHELKIAKQPLAQTQTKEQQDVYPEEMKLSVVGSHSSKENSPEEIMQRYKDGDPNASKELFDICVPLIQGLGRKMGLSNENAEDAAQNTMLKIYQNSDSFDVGRKLHPWVKTIASRTIIDYMRRERRRNSNVIQASSLKGSQGGGESFDLLHSLPSNDKTPRQITSEKEGEAKILSVIAQFKEQYQKSNPALSEIAHYLGSDKKCHEIAEKLDIPVGTVKSRLNAVRKRLRDMLGEDYGEIDKRAA